MQRKTKQSAFTLIELLVVIAIIGILATLAIVALQQARQNARDAKRVADVKQMSTALELFFNDNQAYPTTLEELTTGGYMQILPTAPSVADGTCTPEENDYNYTVGTENSTYTLSFCSGKQVSDISPGLLCMTPGGLTTCGLGGAEPTSGTFVDSRDGQTYAWVKIGDQVWMAENLRYLPSVHGPSTGWSSTTDPRYAVYGYESPNNSTNEAREYTRSVSGNVVNVYETYGVLYNSAAYMQNNGIGGEEGVCPSGWRIPTDAEWHILENSLATDICDPERFSTWGCNPAGQSLMGIDSSSGFDALMGGLRNSVGIWDEIGSSAHFSSSTEEPGWGLLNRYLHISRSDISRDWANGSTAFSVRCIKDY
ncbi:MAG: FISUMP domain-containing protein [Patescibacteria group bacterium]